ncbi:unnamed protein product [marine sediment metagenome]|uniref:Uncharacterized protein n=1 Tax=marine sediment metagenome TaxID=412755 RepID=X1LDJ7_9ZZZZ
MRNINCSDCGKKQWSVADCNYVILYKTCWSCDRKRWENKELTLEEYEKKEKIASQSKEL